MRMPLLGHLKHGTVVFVGVSKKGLDWAKVLADNHFDVEVTFNTEEERVFLERNLGEEYSSITIINEYFSSFSKGDREVDLVITADEDPFKNDKVLEEIGGKSNSFLFRTSVTPSIFANVSLPNIIEKRGLLADVGSSGVNTRLNRKLTEQLKSTVDKKEFTYKCWAVSRLIDDIRNEQNQQTISIDTIKAMLKASPEELFELIMQSKEKLHKHTVIGVVGDPYIYLEAKKFVEVLKRIYPDWHFTLKVFEPASSFYIERCTYENADHLCKKSEEYFRILSKALLNRDIDFGFTDCIYSFYAKKSPLIRTLNNNQCGVEEWPIYYTCDSHVVLNKQGITRFEDIPFDPHFVFDELNITRQIYQLACVKPYEYKGNFKARMMDKPLNQFLRGDSKELDDCFVTCSRANLDLFGFTDEVLKNLGFSIIQDHFATPVGFKDFNLMHRECELRDKDLIFNEQVLKALEVDQDLSPFTKMKIESYFYDSWNRCYDSDYTNIFMVSFEYLPKEKNLILTIFVQREVRVAYECREYNVALDRIETLDLNSILRAILYDILDL